MKHWTFKDYVTANGRNAITDWIDSQPAGTSKRLKSALNTLLLILEGQERLERPSVGQLRGKPCRGLFELILLVDKIQFRPIGCYGPKDDEFTLLAGATENGKKLIPASICDTANTRKQDIKRKERVCDHQFD